MHRSTLSLLFLSLALLAFCHRSGATDIEPRIATCPVCHEPFVVDELLSWGTAESPGGPPTLFSVCPHCFYTTVGDPPDHLTAAEIARIRAVLSTLPQHLAPSVKTWLRAALAIGMNSVNTDDCDRFKTYLSKICEAARQGKPVDSVSPPHFPHALETSSEEKRAELHTLRLLLPKMVNAKLRGENGPLPKSGGDPQMSALFNNAELIKGGDPLAFKYFLLWIRQADLEALKRNDLAVSDNLKAIATNRDRDWPTVDYSQARVPLIVDCLRYLHGQSPLPASISARLSARSWDELTCITLTACTARRDRAAAAFVAQAMARHLDPADAVDAIEDYYVHVGIPTDLPGLERYAKYACPDSGHLPKSRSWYTGLRRDLERATLQIRLKAILGENGDTGQISAHP